MAMKTNLNTKPAIPQPIEDKFQDVNDIKIPTPEELGFDSNDFNQTPLPQLGSHLEMPKEEKKGFFSKFSKKSEAPKTEPLSIPDVPNLETFSFPEFDKNPIQPVQNLSPEKKADTEFLKDKFQAPIQMPKLEKTQKPEKKTESKKMEAQDLIDSHSADDDETFNSVGEKLNEIEAALKKHLDEIEQKMSAVKTIEKELKALDFKIVKSPKTVFKTAKKKSVKSSVKSSKAKKGKKK